MLLAATPDGCLLYTDPAALAGAVAQLTNGPDNRAFRPGAIPPSALQAGGMMRSVARRTWAWLCRRSALVLLVVTASGLAAGGLARLAGDGAVADAAWLATAACGIGYALWSAIDSIRHGRVGVDLIALLALAGAVATRELLAAAVVSVMLASGRALEAWADERARHDLNALLARAPRTGPAVPRRVAGDGAAR